jgi:aarF domain-containing kinase
MPWKSISRVFIPVSILATTGFFTYQYQTNPATKRTITLWKELGPVIIHYRFIEASLKYSPSWIIDEQETPYERLHSLYSSKVMETLRDLRGFYVKVAQVMANRSDILPPIYIEKLRVLEDAVPPLLTGPEARKFIEKSLELERLEDVFEDFEEEPIGSASIGQVHKAKLKRNGKEVAIKVQGPGSEKLFRMDIAAARNFCRVFAPEQVAIFDEIEKQFLSEFDYRKEALNLKAVGENMKNAGFTRVVVPEPYQDLCTENVLTMEFLKGPKLVDGAREKVREYAESIGKTFQELENEWKENIKLHGMPSPYNGPGAFQLEMYKKAVLIKDGILNSPLWVVNTGLALYNYLFKQNRQPYLYYKSFIPLNSSFVMDTLLKAHGHQLLINGFFNADPHPGT